jgi:hypothetical protein
MIRITRSLGRTLAQISANELNLSKRRNRALTKIGYCLTISMSGIFQLLSKSDFSGP